MKDRVSLVQNQRYSIQDSREGGFIFDTLEAKFRHKELIRGLLVTIWIEVADF